MNLLKLALAFLFAFQALAANSNTHNSLIQIVESGLLTGQEDASVMETGYVTEDGGLCGPTTTGIILAAIDHLNGRPFVLDAKEIIRITDAASRIINGDARRFKDDARDGLGTDQLVALISSETKKKGADLTLSGSSIDPDTGVPEVPGFSKTTFENKPDDTIYVLITQMFEVRKRSKKYLWHHYSLGFGFDSEAMTLKVIDPLHPKEVQIAKLVPTDEHETRKPTFKVVFDHRIPGHPKKGLNFLTEIIQINGEYANNVDPAEFHGHRDP